MASDKSSLVPGKRVTVSNATVTRVSHYQSHPAWNDYGEATVWRYEFISDLGRFVYSGCHLGLHVKRGSVVNLRGTLKTFESQWGNWRLKRVKVESEKPLALFT